MPVRASSTNAHRKEAKIVLYSLWSPDDEHVCSKYVEA